jgi:hypothetical protein
MISPRKNNEITYPDKVLIKKVSFENKVIELHQKNILRRRNSLEQNTTPRTTDSTILVVKNQKRRKSMSSIEVRSKI